METSHECTNKKCGPWTLYTVSLRFTSSLAKMKP